MSPPNHRERGQETAFDQWGKTEPEQARKDLTAD